MEAKEIKIDIRRLYSRPQGRWKIACENYDYGMFRNEKPKHMAERLIRTVFSDEEIQTKEFVYLAHTYRGLNSCKDTLDVFYREKMI